MYYRFLRYPQGLSKAATFSYDDGNPADKKLSDIFSARGMKCTFNLCGARAGEGYEALTDEEIKSYFLSRGHEVAVHGEWHKALGIISPIAGIRDVLNCRIELEKRLGRIIRGMAYADCGIRRFTDTTSYENIKRYLTDLGICYSRTLGKVNEALDLPDDFHAWMPTAHHDNPAVDELLDEFLKVEPEKAYDSARYSRLFFIWGHSFEFVQKNNWSRIEEICDKLAEAGNIWFATNMEIYEYTEAYNRLVFSAEEDMVYNPSLIPVWFEYGKKLFKVESGETLKIEF